MAEADETTTVYAAGRDGQPIGDWRDSQEVAEQDAATHADLMRQTKLTPDVVVLQGTRTVAVTDVAPVGGAEPEEPTAEPTEEQVNAEGLTFNADTPAPADEDTPTDADAAAAAAQDTAASGYYPAS